MEGKVGYGGDRAKATTRNGRPTGTGKTTKIRSMKRYEGEENGG
jgi:hypothetical protein